MIAALLGCDGASKDGAGFARLLEFGAGRMSRWAAVEGHLLAQLAAPDAKPGWAPGRAPSGRLALFNGQLHNHAALAAELGADAGDDAALYALAVDRWGDAADERVIGHYCAIAFNPERTSLRLARSPFQAPPLHFRQDGRRALAASLPRPLFWQCDTPRQVNLDRLARSTLVDFTDRFAGWYEGCGRVPLGAAITLTAAGFAESWRYDLFSRPRQRLARDQDYVDAANALLDEGVAAVCAGSRRPGVLLSGGLDSSQVAVSALRHLPEAQDLPSFTYGPEAQWAGAAPPGRYASEFPAVARLAAAHPRLSPEFFTHDGQDFRHGLRDLLAAMDCGAPALGLAWAYHDLYQRARARGCDVLLTGDWGNMTFSNAAPWAAVEFFRRGQWWRLWQLLRHEPHDPRPLWRRFVARVIMPQLPGGLWRQVYGWWHGAPPEGLRGSGLAPAWAARHQLVEQARSAGWDIERMQFTSQRQFWQRLMTEDGQDHEQVLQGLQQLYGIPLRDPTAYRPLVEFCFGVPTAQFTRGPMNRFLARRMAAGRLPDELRLQRERGLDHADWPLRIDRARGELIAELDRMAGDDDISAMFDLPGLRRSLEEFAPGNAAAGDAIVLQCALPQVIAAGRFIAYAKGRNDI
jgi:asparagine synthase (glutamine-hydrolysing)